MAEKRFTLRMDADLFNTVRHEAAISKRSVAKEIEFALEKYYGITPDILEEKDLECINAEDV